MARDSGWPVIPSELAETLRQLDEQTEAVRQAFRSPALEALRTTLPNFDLLWTPEGRALLAERAELRRRDAIAAAAVRGWQEILHALAAWVEMRVKTLLAQRPAASPVIDPATEAVDPSLILEAEEQADQLTARFPLVAATFSPREQVTCRHAQPL